MAKKTGQTTEKTLQNQRIAIWLIVGFVAFITLWFVYSVKTLQNTAMTTSSEAASGGTVKYGGSCTRSDFNRYKNSGRGVMGYGGSYRAYCCKKSDRSAQYVWQGTKCPVGQ